MAKTGGIRSGTMVVAIAGAVLSYAAVKGKGITPSLRALLGGNNPADTPGDIGKAISSGVDKGSGDSGGNASPGVSGGLSGDALTGTRSANRRIGQLLAMARGWVGKEWSALDSVIMRESEWDSEAVNPSSHAGGIGQANPYTKMPRIAWPRKLGGNGSPVAQIAWTYDYISRTYGKPSVAWAHEQSQGWY